MNAADPTREDQEIDQLLADTDGTIIASNVAESTVGKLRSELATLELALQQPASPDPYQNEAACVRAVGLVAAMGRDPESVSERRPTKATQELGELGPYQLLDWLGEGGMGTVYKALHSRLDKLVAIKVLPAERLKSEDALGRFQREMKAVGKVDHPHLVRALDAGEANGTHYLVMEFVSGTDLGALLKQRGPLPVADACELIAQAAAGLHAAHSRGMIHRDIKPANLMLAEQEFGPPIVKVLDLGLALLSESQTPNAGGLTSDGQIMGTIDYMPPEQAQDSHLVDERADIYSLGASLYALLTGGSIFSGRPNATLMQKLMTLATEPIPPIRERRPEVPEPLAAIVHRMVTREPKQRFASMAEVITALKPFAAGANLIALLSPHQQDSPASGSIDENSRLSETVRLSADDHSLARRASFATADIRRNALASGSEGATTHEPDASVFRLRSNRRTLIVAAVAGVVLLGAILFSIKTQNGEVIVEIPDDLPAEVRKEIKISVTGDGAAEVASEANGWKVGIKEGKYSVELTGGQDRVEVDDKQVMVSRNKKAIVTIKLKPFGEMVAKNNNDKPAGSAPPLAIVPFNAEAGAVGPRWPLQPTSPDEIKFFLDHLNCAVTVRGDTNGDLVWGSGTALPMKPVTVVGVNFHGAFPSKVDDDVFRRLATLTDLEELHYGFGGAGDPKVTTAGGRELGSLVNLRRFSVSNQFIGGFDFSVLSKMTQLDSLFVTGFAASEWVRNAVGLKKLTRIDTAFVHWTDEDIEELAGCLRLSSISLHGNIPANLALAKKLPWCRIRSGAHEAAGLPGVIEPTAPHPEAGLRTDDAVGAKPGVVAEVPGLTVPETPFTLEGYVKFDRPQLGENPTLFGWKYQFVLGATGDGIGVTHFTKGDNVPWKEHAVRAVDNLPRGQWHHVAAVRDGNQNRLYFNGELVAQLDVTEAIRPPNATSPEGVFVIGSACHGVTFRDVRVSKVARYGADKFAPAPRFIADADTLALFACDELSGNILLDSSGKGQNGKIIKAKWGKAAKSNSGKPADPDRKFAE